VEDQQIRHQAVVLDECLLLIAHILGNHTVAAEGDPLTPLRVGVDRVKAGGDFSFDMVPDCVRRQAEALAGFLVCGPAIVMPIAPRVQTVGLEYVGPPLRSEPAKPRPERV
jgi:hypothetical protein